MTLGHKTHQSVVIFRMNHTYHNCLLDSSHLENPSVLMGWQSRIGMVCSFFEGIIHILKSLLNYLENSPNWGYITIMPNMVVVVIGHKMADPPPLADLPIFFSR